MPPSAVSAHAHRRKSVRTQIAKNVGSSVSAAIGPEASQPEWFMKRKNPPGPESAPTAPRPTLAIIPTATSKSQAIFNSPHLAPGQPQRYFAGGPIRHGCVSVGDFLRVPIATPDPRAKFEARFQAIHWRDLGNSRLKKIFTILNLASCFWRAAAPKIM